MEPQDKSAEGDRVLYLRYELVPKAEKLNAEHVGGSFLCCWIKADTQAEAEAIAREVIGEEGWLIRHFEEACTVTRVDYCDDPETCGYFDQAVMDGVCFVFHTWPANASE